MPPVYAGVEIRMQLSSARRGEAAYREMSLDRANEVLRRHVQTLLERRFPGALIAVETAGDQPTAEVSGVEDYRAAQTIRAAAEKIALTVKWDFSTLGLGLKPL